MSGEALELGREIKSIPGVSSTLRSTILLLVVEVAVGLRNSEAFISIADRSAGGGGVFGPLAFTSDVWSLNVTKLEDDRPLLVPWECRS